MQAVFLIVCLVLCARQAMSFMATPLRAKLASASLKMCAADKPKAGVIGKGDLLGKLQDMTGFRKKDLDLVLSSLVDVIRADVLVGGNEIRLRDFGTFKQKNLPARTGRNPKTGEALQIGASTTVTFSPSDTGFRVRHES